MKHNIILTILIMLIIGCSAAQDKEIKIDELMLNEQDMLQIGIINNAGCQTEEQTSFSSSTVQYSVCYYNISSLDNTEVVVELKEFTTFEDLNGTYQYDSSHLFSVQGLISENEYGDLSRFRMNNENDYGGEFNPPGIYYYHLWICKDKFLIHITSGGSKDAKEYIVKIGEKMLEKFE